VLNCLKNCSLNCLLNCVEDFISYAGKDIEGYRQIKRCYIFKYSNCTLQNIKNELPSEAGATNFIYSENSVVSEETTTEKVNSSSSQRPSTLFPQSTPFIFVPPPLISPISSPIFVPPHIISPLSSPFFGFPPS
jgi:hypothetical protein